MKVLKLVIFVIFIAALLAVGWFALGSDGHQVHYRTAKITRGDIAEVVTVTGALNPIQMVTVGTQVSGQVDKVYVHANENVKKGELLAEIDPSLLLAQLKQDQAALETAKVNFDQSARDRERTRYLLAKDYVAKVDMEHAEQAYLSAKNSYDSSKTVVDRDKVNLGYTKITSPIDGVIIEQEVTLGQTMAASFQAPDMFKIAGDLTKMKIDVNLSESDIGKVKIGMPVTFTVDAFPNREFTGKVQTVNISPNTQQGVVTYTAVVSVENKDRSLLPGMTAYVNVILSEKKGVLRVPAEALRFRPPVQKVSALHRLFGGGGGNVGYYNYFNNNQDDDKKTLYLLRSGRLAPVIVTTGASDDNNVEITGNGINAGDTVVTGIVPERGQ